MDPLVVPAFSAGIALGLALDWMLRMAIDARHRHQRHHDR